MNGNREEEEDVFLDATDSVENTQTQGLRRSARKRKTVDAEVDSTATPTHVGKRHRPLGKMGGVQRSTDTGRPAGRSEKEKDKQSNRQSTGGLPKPNITVATDPPTDTPTAEQMVLLGGIREILKQELQATETRLSGRINNVESSVDGLQVEFRDLEERVSSMERRLEQAPGPSGILEDTAGLSGHSRSRIESPVTKLARYWKSRKSLRMWPIKGEGDQMRLELQKFMGSKLGLGEDVLVDVADCSIRRVPTGKKKGGIEHEVVVEFPTVDLRDVVRAAAYNLANHPDSGIRLEIPHHLMANFKALSSASYQLKQKFPQCKRNMKYDDESTDLVLDFKTGQDQPWRKLRPAQAKGIGRGTSSHVEEMSTDDMTELLEEGTQDEEED